MIETVCSFHKFNTWSTIFLNIKKRKTESNLPSLETGKASVVFTDLTIQSITFQYSVWENENNKFFFGKIKNWIYSCFFYDFHRFSYIIKIIRLFRKNMNCLILPTRNHLYESHSISKQQSKFILKLFKKYVPFFRKY